MRMMYILVRDDIPLGFAMVALLFGPHSDPTPPGLVPAEYWRFVKRRSAQH
jgi:hypothetical protein